MAVDLTSRDDEGRPMDRERYQRLIERETAERDAEPIVVRRYPTLAADMVCLSAVETASGRILVQVNVPRATASFADESWLLQRAQQELGAPQKPTLRVVRDSA